MLHCQFGNLTKPGKKESIETLGRLSTAQHILHLFNIFIINVDQKPTHAICVPHELF